MKFKFIFLLCILLNSCVQAPLKRVHVAASVNRYFYVEPAVFKEKEVNRVGLDLGLSRSFSVSDVGNLHESSNFYFSPNLKLGKLTAGIVPYFGKSHVHVDDNKNLGLGLWVDAFMWGNGAASVHSQVTYESSSNRKQEQASSHPFFTQADTIDKAHAYASAREFGARLIAYFNAGNNSTLFVSPGFYYSEYAAGNYISNDQINNYNLYYEAYSPSLRIGMQRAFESGLTSISLVLGVDWPSSFGPNSQNSMVYPNIQLKLGF